MWKVQLRAIDLISDSHQPPPTVRWIFSYNHIRLCLDSESRDIHAGEAKGGLKAREMRRTNTKAASFHRFDTVVGITIVAPNLPQLSVVYCSPFTSSSGNKIKYWDASAAGTQEPHR
jgi:hypothetical protein